MEVFLIFPKSQQANQELREELAKFQAEQALKSVQKLPCSSMEMSRNVQSGNTQNLKSPVVPVRLPVAPAPTPGTSQAAAPAGCAYRS